MATYIDLDSFFRDRDEFPNENNFQLTPSQTNGWFAHGRSIRATASNPNLQPLEFVTTVNISNFITPYTPALIALPRIYVNFRSLKFDDQFLINTAGNIHPEAKFVCVTDKIQYSDDKIPLWIHWKSTMEQTLRFARNYPVELQIRSRNGSILPQLDTNNDTEPNPFSQITCTFEITPYIRDGDYDNQMIDTFTG